MQPLEHCIGPTIRIGREILCLLYAGFFITQPLQHCIGPTIRIGQESWCLPYAGFFLQLKRFVQQNKF